MNARFIEAYTDSDKTYRSIHVNASLIEAYTDSDKHIEAYV